MELIVVVIVLGGLWAALLLPSFLDSRHDAPLASTRHFDRNIAKLAALSPNAVDPAAQKRRKIQIRRRRVLIALILSSVGTLVAAVVVGSLPLLLVSLAIDALLVSYVLVLAQIRRARQDSTVVGLEPDDAPERPRLRMVINR